MDTFVIATAMAFSILAGVCDAQLKCYVCSSIRASGEDGSVIRTYYDGDCHNGKTSELTVINCEDGICSKSETTLEISSEDVRYDVSAIVRACITNPFFEKDSCTDIKSAGLDAYYFDDFVQSYGYEYETDTADGTFCTCDSDYCNASSQLMSSVSLALTVITAAMFCY